MMEINISGREPAALPQALATKAMALTFKVAKRKASGSLGLAFVTESRIEALNREHRGRNAPTDVLSFAPTIFPGQNGKSPELGDIVICAAYVKADAKKSAVSYPQQMLRVFVHGILHLLGYDHAELADEKRMFALQEKVVKACGL